MIELALQILLIASLLFISFQDIRDRMVYWVSYIITGIAGFVLFMWETNLLPSLAFVAINLIVVLLVILIAAGYARFVMKRGFINDSIGSGDILFFLMLALAFPTITFVTLFVFSLVFALMLHKVMLLKNPDNDVPLAGYMALFYAAVYFVSIFVEPEYLFSQ